MEREEFWLFILLKIKLTETNSYDYQSIRAPGSLISLPKLSHNPQDFSSLTDWQPDMWRRDRGASSLLGCEIILFVIWKSWAAKVVLWSVDYSVQWT